jgi:hypothetical protein
VRPAGGSGAVWEEPGARGSTVWVAKLGLDGSPRRGRRGCAQFRACLAEEPDGSGGLAPLAHRLVFGCQLGEERAQARGQGWGMAVFGAKVQVKAHALVVARTLVCRHLSLIQPPLEGDRYVGGNLLRGNDFGRCLPLLSGCWRLWNRGLGAACGKDARISFTAELAPDIGAVDERKGFISRRDLLAYHPKRGR